MSVRSFWSNSHFLVILIWSSWFGEVNIPQILPWFSNFSNIYYFVLPKFRKVWKHWSSRYTFFNFLSNSLIIKYQTNSVKRGMVVQWYAGSEGPSFKPQIRLKIYWIRNDAGTLGFNIYTILFVYICDWWLMAYGACWACGC